VIRTLVWSPMFGPKAGGRHSQISTRKVYTSLTSEHLKLTWPMTAFTSAGLTRKFLTGLGPTTCIAGTSQILNVLQELLSEILGPEHICWSFIYSGYRRILQGRGVNINIRDSFDPEGRPNAASRKTHVSILILVPAFWKCSNKFKYPDIHAVNGRS
jgi:hypothetical protein